VRFGFRAPGRITATGTILVCCLLLAPAFAAMRTAPPAGALSLGGGTYQVTATAFGVPSDNLVGNQTSSGHVLAKNDRLVALPACTESSCPWVPTGTGVEGEWGPQTTCVEDDGLCWVEITSLDTGACTVAPVLDRGPLFIKDNWWELRDFRTYHLKKGYPAAEAAAKGANFGFGRGISDRGHDVQDDFSYAAAIDLAAGTWVDLGLDQGIAEVEVTLLWQAGIDHEDACGGYGNARTTDWVNLRAGPSTNDDVLTVLDTGDRLGIIGGGRNGYYPVVHDGLTGWVFDDYVRPDGADGPGVPVGIVTERVNFRAGPSTGDDVLRRLPAGTLAVLTGEEENDFLSASVDGVDGWVFAQYLDTGRSGSTGGSNGNDDDDEGGGSGSTAITAVTTDRLNLRHGPSTSDDVLLVMPDGAEVTLTGKEIDGYFSLSYQGTKGWAHGDYLSNVRRVTEDLNLRTGPSTGDDVIVVMPAGARVALLGGEENGFVQVRYHGRNGWAYAAYLD
jgi:uncharacterized protein YraI